MVVHAGGYSDYRERLRAQAAAELASGAQARRRDRHRQRDPGSRGARVERAKSTKGLSFKEERELDGLFERIEAAEERASTLEQKLSDPDTYKREGDAVAELQRAFDGARAEIERLTERWEVLEFRKTESGSG